MYPVGRYRAFLGRNRTALEPVRERISFDELQNKKARIVGLLQVIDRGNVGMVEGREHFRFALKAADPIRIACKLIRQDFDCDFALQFRVACTIDLAHSAFAEQGGDFKRSELRADCDGHGIGPDYS